MFKKALFSILLAVVAFSYLGMANSITLYRLKFKANTTFLVEPNGKMALPAGEYLVREVGQASGNLFSLERAQDHKHMALLNTVRAHETYAKARFGAAPKVIFDLEDASQLPVLKKFYSRDADGYEVISAVYDKDAGLIDTASISKAK